MNNKTIRLIISISVNIIIVIAGIFLIYTVGNKAFTFGVKVFNEQSVDLDDNAREVEVTITDSTSISQLSTILYDKGLITDKTVFRVQAELSEYKDKLIGGTYVVKTSMKPTEIMKILSTKTETEDSE